MRFQFGNQCLGNGNHLMSTFGRENQLRAPIMQIRYAADVAATGRRAARDASARSR
jgi:hypothetical protein